MRNLLEDLWPIGACGRQGDLVFRIVAYERNRRGGHRPILKFADLTFTLCMPWSYLADAEPLTEDAWLIACLTQ